MKNIVQEKNFAQWAQDYVLLTLSSNGCGRGWYGNIYMLGALFQGGRGQGGGGWLVALAGFAESMGHACGLFFFLTAVAVGV